MVGEVLVQKNRSCSKTKDGRDFGGTVWQACLVPGGQKLAAKATGDKRQWARDYLNRVQAFRFRVDKTPGKKQILALFCRKVWNCWNFRDPGRAFRGEPSGNTPSDLMQEAQDKPAGDFPLALSALGKQNPCIKSVFAAPDWQPGCSPAPAWEA